MKRVILFIAVSLDGYIADENGGVGWLAGEDPNADDMEGYGAFIQGIDTVIIGGATYRQIAHELSPDKWPYAGLQSYVLTSRPEKNRENITFFSSDLPGLVRKLRQEPGKDIWICGGARIVNQLAREGLIDEYQISVIPLLLGGGIRLFESGLPSTKLHLKRVQAKNGMVESVYEIV